MSGIESDSEDLESVEGGGGEGEQEVAGSSGPEEVGAGLSGGLCGRR